MKFVDLGSSIVNLENLITAEPINSSLYGPIIKLEYLREKAPRFVRFETMQKANDAFEKLVDEMKKNGIIS